MTSRETADAARLLRRLARGLEKREALHSGAAREGLDVHLLELVERLKTQIQSTFNEDAPGPPPRSVSVPLAMAVFCQPHLDITFGAPRWQGTEDLIPPELPESDYPLVFPMDVIKRVLALEEWELDELREEVDRRVGTVLKQHRAMQWLWRRFDMPHGDPRTLFHALFPAAPLDQKGSIGWVYYGAQLYAVIDQNPPPPVASLYLGWLPADDVNTFSPMAAFQGRYVDEGLRRALGRGIGASDGEVVELLDRMVTILPRKGCTTYLAHDQWRITGVAPMANLGAAYGSGTWLTRPLAANELYVKDFLEVRDGGLQVKNPEASFDAYATDRATTMLAHLYAEMLARLMREDAHALPRTTVEDLSLYDLARHLRRILRPLLDWAHAPETVAHVHRVIGVPEEEARDKLAEVGKRWEARAARVWWGTPARDGPEPVSGALLRHVLSSHNNLRHAFRRHRGRQMSHRDLLLLFAAHHYAEVSVSRLLRDNRQGKAPVDPVGRWFWGLWHRLAAEVDVDTDPTWSGPSPILT